MTSVELVGDVTEGDLPAAVALPARDRPILLSALAAGASHLLTGDSAHFGHLYGRTLAGLLVERSAEYLRDRRLA